MAVAVESGKQTTENTNMVAPFKQRIRGIGPFDLFDELHRELGRFFGEPLEQALTGMHSVPVNMAGNEDGLSLSMELPGFSRDDIDLQVEGRVLTVTATVAKKDVEQADAEPVTSWVMKQRDVRDVTRRVDLPFEIELEHVKARMEHGVLHIDLPRREASKPRKISIEG